MTEPDQTTAPEPEAPEPGQGPQEPVQDAPTPEPVPDTDKVIGLRGEPANLPSGLWRAAVDADGDLVRQDGLLVRVREDGTNDAAAALAT